LTWHWLALTDERPADADAAAAAHERDGTPAGWLAIWTRHAKPLRDARRIDARLLDPDGAAAVVSLVRPPPGVRLLFDDLAVQHARRAVLSAAPQDAVTTLLSDASHFEGSHTVARGAGVARLADDPFARVFPARVLHVAAGLLGRVPAPAGPVIERYGSEQPWPRDRFAA
jgi:phosphoglycolate phosphatase-like HAD superfamily hydrolase